MLKITSGFSLPGYCLETTLQSVERENRYPVNPDRHIIVTLEFTFSTVNTGLKRYEKRRETR